MSSLTLGSLFDGSGGFTLGGNNANLAQKTAPCTKTRCCAYNT